MIPRIIHQIWINSSHSYPEEWEKGRESIRKMIAHSPAWQYIFWDTKKCRELVSTHYPHLLEKYDAYPYDVQRADVARTCILDQWGGVYLDLDMVLQKPLDPLFEHCSSDLYLVRTAHRKSWILNGFIASAPGCPFWKKLHERFLQDSPWFVSLSKYFTVTATTGSYQYERVLESYYQPYCFIPMETLIPTSCYSCKKGVYASCGASAEGYIYLLGGSSWGGWGSKLFLTLFCHWKEIAVIVAILVLILLWMFYRFYHRCQACLRG
jgi:mannosyltransferase OCH1-like enzyme